ncbi:ATP-binding protein [Bacteroidota bacterium]
MIKRDAEAELIELSRQFKAVAVTGPRQSGKTTLVRKVFGHKPYISLENPDTRKYAQEDPRGFLSDFPDGAVLDEIQRAPELFSYLQQILDETSNPGSFILTGSNNFLLQENISQSLAGRVGYLFLLPLSLNEIKQYEIPSNQLMIKGGYPYLFDQKVTAGKYYANYISTYVERDLRQLKNITNLFAFERFLRLCAGRTGQLLNMNNMATEVGVDVKTIASWIGVLETSFVAFRLQPYYKNYNKRVVKTPKLYFYDTGLASSLLGINQPEELSLSPFRGGLFENLVVVEFLKHHYNHGINNKLWFWRNNTGNEIDLLVDNGVKQIPVEIKSGKTISEDFFKGLKYWGKLTGEKNGFLIYDGTEKQSRSDGITVLPLSEITKIRI